MVFEAITLDAAVLLAHVLGLVWGAGGATAAGIMMLLSEKNPSIRPALPKIMPMFAKMTWAGLILLILSGIGLSAIESGNYDVLTLMVKHLLVAIIVIDAILITFLFTPKHERLAPKPGETPSKEWLSNYSHMKKVGMLSMTSWYLVIILSVLM